VYGTFELIDVRQPKLGSLLALVPLRMGLREQLSIYSLLFFFALLLLLSLGIVLTSTTQLSQPLRALDLRAQYMGTGQLHMPMPAIGEFDEIGRLTASFDKMRQRLQDKIDQIEQLNVGLERKVEERTAQLESSNDELRQAIAALREAQQRLIISEKLASVGQLVAGIAHEINNPINAVANTLDPLTDAVSRVAEMTTVTENTRQRDELVSDLKEMVKVIRSGANRTKRIVNALRNVNRGDDEELATVDLAQDIEEDLALLRQQLEGIEVSLDLAGPPTILAYRGQFNQALINLLSNAADAVRGRPGSRIWISTRTIDGGTEITIRDNGRGIPPALQQRIFDPFFTSKPVGQGTGLGLSITHGIIDRHGGSIAVESAANEGTAFRIRLPR
jgi:signal transduction histidine kinase